MVGATIALAVFMNPTIKIFVNNGNHMKGCFFLTLTSLMKQ